MTRTTIVTKSIVASAIDSRAESKYAESAVFHVPRDENDLSQGFNHITWKQFANAINHAAWWLESNVGPKTSDKFEVFAYQGPNDLRYPILAVAAAKVGKQMLLPFSLAPPPIKIHLVDATGCKYYLHAQFANDQVGAFLSDRPNVHPIAVPELNEWLTDNEAPQYPYKKNWPTGNHDPWLIFHTSGTTGLPTPVTYTQNMMTSFYYRLRKAHDIDGHAIVGGVDQSQIKTQLGHLAYAKVYTVVPLSHFSGMAAALQGGVFLFSILVLGPSMKPPTPPLVTEILQYSGAKAFVAMPSLLRAMCQNPSTVEALKSLDFVQWIGAALDSATGSTLSQITRISPAMGTTECGPYFLITPEESKDWEYYIFQEGQGIEFIKREGGLFELVFRKYSNAGWQQVFEVYPNLEVYETKDLFMKHPEKEGFWAYAGRSDDMVVLSNSANINAAAVEEKLMQHPNVQVALVGGSGRDHSFAIISLASVAREQIPSNDPDAALNLVWPAVEHANKGLSDYSKLKRNFILIVEEGLVVGPKGTVLRGPSLKLFADKINALFVNK